MRGLLTAKQAAVLAVLEPADGSAQYADAVAERAGLTDRGALFVLYHLADAGLVTIDEFGYYLTRKGERERRAASRCTR
jgi:hypothetical protein